MPATHFIEIYLSKGKQITGSVQDIKNLKKNTDLTKNSSDLTPFFCWKITPKPDAVLVSKDKELEVLIVESA